MKNATPVLFIFLAAGLFSAVATDDSEGELVLSITAKESAHRGPIDQKEGAFFYLTEQDEAYGPTLNGDVYSHGELVRGIRFGSGESKEILASLREIGLQSFSFQEEIRKIRENLDDRGSQERIPPFKVDGTKIEIHYRFEGNEIRFSDWNPGDEIYFYSRYSENFKKLQTAIDLLLLRQSRSLLGL